jgi:hypothetical protein
MPRSVETMPQRAAAGSPLPRMKPNVPRQLFFLSDTLNIENVEKNARKDHERKKEQKLPKIETFVSTCIEYLRLYY